MSLRADWVRKAHGSTLCGGISAEAVIDRAGVYPGRERPLSVPPMRANDPLQSLASRDSGQSAKCLYLRRWL